MYMKIIYFVILLQCSTVVIGSTAEPEIPLGTFDRQQRLIWL